MVDSVKSKKSGLAKAATILVMVFLVSLGLCGADFVGISLGVGAMKWADWFLNTNAKLGLLGMAVSAAGLFVVGVLAIIKGLIDDFSTKSSDPVSIIEKDEDK